jgi:hypothetical protein
MVSKGVNSSHGVHTLSVPETLLRCYQQPDEATMLNVVATASERGVAQSGSAPALGAGGPGFESRRPDGERSNSPLR